MKLEIEIDKDLYHDLEASQYDYERIKDVILTISSMGLYDEDSPETKKWEKRLKDSFEKFQKEKIRFQRETISEISKARFGNVKVKEWTLDYYSQVLTLEVENA